MLCAEATRTVRRKYALSASSWRSPENCFFVLADEPVVRLNAAVEDANPDPGAGRSAQRPVPGNAFRPFDADPDVCRGGRRQAPGRQRLAGVPLRLLLGHTAILNRDRSG